MRSKIIITRTVLLLAVLFASVSAKAATRIPADLAKQYDLAKEFLAKKGIDANQCRFENTASVQLRYAIFYDSAKHINIIVDGEEQKVVGYETTGEPMDSIDTKDFSSFIDVIHELNKQEKGSLCISSTAIVPPMLDNEMKYRLLNRIVNPSKNLYDANAELHMIMTEFAETVFLPEFNSTSLIYRSYDQNENMDVETIYSELKAGRIVYAKTNIGNIIIDGCDGEYLHILFGKGNKQNGYYLNKVIGKIEKIAISFGQVNETRDKTVTLQQPGTLAEALTTSEKENLTKLTIIGKLDARDITVIRRMLGANDTIAAKCGNVGKLMSLDLSQAKFDKSDYTYFVEDVSSARATRTTTKTYSMTDSGRTYNSHTYSSNISINFGNANIEDWKNFKANLKQYYQGDDFKCIYDEEKKHINITCRLNTSNVSRYMFAGCYNLKEIKLPESIKTIGRKAFAYCIQLKDISMPQKVSVFREKAFEGCTSIQHVYVSNDKVKYISSPLKDDLLDQRGSLFYNTPQSIHSIVTFTDKKGNMRPATNFEGWNKKLESRIIHKPTWAEAKRRSYIMQEGAFTITIPSGTKYFAALLNSDYGTLQYILSESLFESISNSTTASDNDVYRTILKAKEGQRKQNNRIGTLSVSGNDEKGEVLKAKEIFGTDPVRPKVEENKVFDVVEQMPSFPGGMGALMQYLSANIKYPESAEDNGIQGRVICTFIVERDGSISDVRIAKSIDPSLDQEAVRVVSSMPKWNPGKQSGSAVRVKYTLPVTFRLQ